MSRIDDRKLLSFSISQSMMSWFWLHHPQNPIIPSEPQPCETPRKPIPTFCDCDAVACECSPSGCVSRVDQSRAHSRSGLYILILYCTVCTVLLRHSTVCRQISKSQSVNCEFQATEKVYAQSTSNITNQSI